MERINNRVPASEKKPADVAEQNARIAKKLFKIATREGVATSSPGTNFEDDFEGARIHNGHLQARDKAESGLIFGVQENGVMTAENILPTDEYSLKRMTIDEGAARIDIVKKPGMGGSYESVTTNASHMATNSAKIVHQVRKGLNVARQANSDRFAEDADKFFRE